MGSEAARPFPNLPASSAFPADRLRPAISFPPFVDAPPVDLADPAVCADLLLAHRTRGEAFRDGRLKTAQAIELIQLSDDVARPWPGSHHLKKLRVYGVARHVAGVVPVEVVGPGRLSSPPFTSIIGVVRDTLSWCSIPAYEKDPRGEFEDRPVPMADDLHFLEASADGSGPW